MAKEKMKLKIEDIKDMANEIELAVNHKDRDLSKIDNKRVKEYLSNKSKELIVSGTTKKVISGAAGVATYSTVAGALAPTITVPVLTAAASAETGAVIAGPIGMPLPVVGPIVAAAIGATVGLAVGITSNAIIGNKQKKELEKLRKDISEKQDLVNKFIEKEAIEIAQNLKEKADEDKRYIYLLAIIGAYEELKKI